MAPRPSPAARPSPLLPDWASIWLGALLLAAVLLLAYGNSFRVPYLLDDEDSIVRNPTLRSLGTALFPPGDSGSTVSGRPLLNFSFAVNRLLTGDNLAGYHAGNLLIHFAAALCLFGVVRRTLLLPVLASRYGDHATRLAWAAAALWALHPVQTESVTYLIQRAESLVGLFYLFTLYAFIRGLAGPSRGWCAAAVVGCFLGMAAKEVMATVPLVLFLYDRTFVSGTFRAAWQRHRGLYAAFASGWVLLLALIVSSGGRGNTVGFSHVGPLEYLLMQGPGITTYLFRAVWPVGLVFDYGAVLEKRPFVLAAGVLFVAALVVLTLLLLRRRPAAGFFGAWFFLILGPSSSLIPVATQTLAEHRLYLPLAALATVVALLVHRLGARLGSVLLGALLLAFGFATAARNTVYQSPLTLWEDTVRKVPDNVRALANLANAYRDANRIDDAIRSLRTALEIAPDYADAHASLGTVLMLQALQQSGESRDAMLDRVELGAVRSGAGRDEAGVAAALASMRRACELAPEQGLVLAVYANGLVDAGWPAEALPLLTRAVDLEPGSAAFRYDLANLFLRLNRPAEAETQYQACLELAPDDAQALTNYGLLLRRMQRLPESLERLRAAVKLQPGSARIRSNLGVSLLASGATAEAIEELTAAVSLDPRLPQAHYHLANSYHQTGRLPEAIRQFELLLTLAPPTAELLNNLGVLYAQTDRLDEAIRRVQQACELDPTHEASRENLAKLMSHRAGADRP